MDRVMKMLMVAVLAAVLAFGCVLTADSQGSDASGSHGTSSSPLSSLYLDGYDCAMDTDKHYYVYVGGEVDITCAGDGGDSAEFCYNISGVTSGYGLTFNSSYYEEDMCGQGRVSGTISKAGTIYVSYNGWNGSNNYNGSVTIHAISQQATEYTCYLYYNANGGTGAPATDSYTGTATTAHRFTVSGDEPTRSGYTFLGWSTSPSATSASYSAGSQISVSYNGSKTLYAVWQSGASYTCYLNYDANGGSGAPSTQSYTGTSTLNHTFTIPSTVPTRSGYTFLGWSASPSANAASYLGGDPYGVAYNGSATLYAVWQQNAASYSITVHKGNWGSFQMVGDGTRYTTSSHTYTVQAGSEVNIEWYGKSPTSGSGTNYTYVRTYTESEHNMSESQYGDSIGDSVTVSGDASYYPATQMEYTTVYTYLYTIAFDANGGTGAPGTIETSGPSAIKSITLPTVTPTKSGYVFQGWAKSSTAATASYSAGSTSTFTYGTSTLYAVWAESGITVSGTPDPYGVVGSAWSYKPSVSVSGCTVSVSGASWLSANGNNVSGTPAQPGTYNVTLTFSKPGYTSATKSFTITVLSALSFESSPTGGAIIYAV